MPGELPVETVWNFATALLIGALLGIEREKHKRTDGDVSIGGPTIAAAAFRAGLVDAVELYLVPVSVGGGTPALPTDLMLHLELTEEHAFPSETEMLRYRVSAPEA